MTETQEATAMLRQRVFADPAWQARLFALDDTDEFLVAVRQLAQSLGVYISDQEIRDALAAGQRAWFERRLPW